MANEGTGGDLPIIDAVTKYEKIKRIGEGTYGIVCKHLTETEVLLAVPQTGSAISRLTSS